jgi:cytochrome c oxidase cbb3-type subunit 3
MKTILSTGLLVMALLLPGIGSANDAEENYRTYCWQCHGMAGKGNGVNVRDMSVNPRDHTDGAEMKSLTDARIFKAIKGGGSAVSSSVLMPAWESVFSDQEIGELVAYLRVLCNCKGSDS